MAPSPHLNLKGSIISVEGDILRFMSQEYQNLLAVGHQAALKAAAIAIAQRRDHTVSVNFKGARDLVTSADLACESAIIEVIKANFPEHKILAEESKQSLSPADYGSGYVWVIDPIDGTTNYAHDLPHVGISVACVKDGQTVAGVVAAPFYNEIFTATKGSGAYLNDQPIHCRSVDSVKQALITTGFPYDRDNVPNISRRLERVLAQCRDLRRLGAASLDCCWVACGRLDAYFEETVKSWDAAAGVLIAREAGATLGHYNYDHPNQRLTADYPGDLFVDNLVLSAPGILDELLDILNLKTAVKVGQNGAAG
jgi:myo-inositol-1(or 4)-monophosphatase